MQAWQVEDCAALARSSGRPIGEVYAIVEEAARAAYDSCRADAPGDDRFEDDLVGDPGFPPPPPELMLGI